MLDEKADQEEMRKRCQRIESILCCLSVCVTNRGIASIDFCGSNSKYLTKMSYSSSHKRFPCCNTIHEHDAGTVSRH